MLRQLNKIEYHHPGREGRRSVDYATSRVPASTQHSRGQAPSAEHPPPKPDSGSRFPTRIEMVSVRLPDAVSSLVEQLQRGVEDFDSLARKLENEVDAPGEGVLAAVYETS